MEALVVDYIKDGLLLVVGTEFILVQLDIPNLPQQFPIGKRLPITLLHWEPSKYGPS